jgi:hydroxybutyrate-dimer hydrolase
VRGGSPAAYCAGALPSTRPRPLAAAVALALVLTFAACTKGEEPPPNVKPVNVGTITKTYYDGMSDDLLTAGLGRTGLAGTAPRPVDPVAPTAAELRRLAIFSNYAALVDVSPKGGYGTLFGPNIDPASLFQGKR